MQGEIALAFGDLLRKLWLPGRTPVPPRTFKSKLARFAPQFSGYNQHDSQVSNIIFSVLLLSPAQFCLVQYFVLLFLNSGQCSLVFSSPE